MKRKNLYKSPIIILGKFRLQLVLRADFLRSHRKYNSQLGTELSVSPKIQFPIGGRAFGLTENTIPNWVQSFRSLRKYNSQLGTELSVSPKVQFPIGYRAFGLTESKIPN